MIQAKQENGFRSEVRNTQMTAQSLHTILKRFLVVQASEIGTNDEDLVECIRLSGELVDDLTFYLTYDLWASDQPRVIVPKTKFGHDYRMFAEGQVAQNAITSKARGRFSLSPVPAKLMQDADVSAHGRGLTPKPQVMQDLTYTTADLEKSFPHNFRLIRMSSFANYRNVDPKTQKREIQMPATSPYCVECGKEFPAKRPILVVSCCECLTCSVHLECLDPRPKLETLVLQVSAVKSGHKCLETAVEANRKPRNERSEDEKTGTDLTEYYDSFCHNGTSPQVQKQDWKQN